MAVVTQELVTKFGFTGDLGKLDTFNAGLGKALTGLGAIAAAASAAGGALFAFVSSTTANIDPMVQLHRETGVAFERIQELGFAASVSGSSAEALQGSIKGLSQRLGEAVNGGGEGVAIFERFGIQLRDASGQVRNVDDVLDDVRRNMIGLSTAERISVANKLGIDPSLIQLLSSTDEQLGALTEQARELGVVTQEQGDAAAAFNDSLTILGYALDSIRNSIAVGFAPQMQDLIERFVNFLAANRELLEYGINAVANGIMALLEMLGRLAPFIAAAAGVFTVMALAGGGLATVLGLLFSPIVLITGAFVAALLVLDDLIVAFQDGDSYIRAFFQSFFGIDITPILQGIVGAFMDMMDGVMGAFVPLGKAISSLFSGVTALARGDFRGMVEGIQGFFAGLFDYLIETWSAVVGFFGDMINLAFPGIIADIKSFFADAFSWITDRINTIIDGFKRIGSFLGIGEDAAESAVSASSAGRMLPGGTASLTQSSNINQDIEINVTSSDPQAAALAVRDQLQEQLRDAETQYSRGGR